MYKELIKQETEKIKLIKELQFIADLQKFDYLINKVDTFNFELIEVKTNGVIKIDTIERIDAWLKIRSKTNIFRNY